MHFTKQLVLPFLVDEEKLLAAVVKKILKNLSEQIRF